MIILFKLRFNNRQYLGVYAFIVLAVFQLTGCSVVPWRAATPMVADFRKAPVIRPFADEKWLLLEPLTFDAIREQDGRSFSITIPAGFVSDLASIPVPANIVFDKTGSYSSAGILHDWLYWVQMCSRATSDRLIKEGLKASGSAYMERNAIKIAVYVFGSGSWNGNFQRRKGGEERYVPPGFREFSAKTNWEDYRLNFQYEVPPWGLLSEQKRIDNSICSIFDLEIDRVF